MLPDASLKGWNRPALMRTIVLAASVVLVPGAAWVGAAAELAAAVALAELRSALRSGEEVGPPGEFLNSAAGVLQPVSRIAQPANRPASTPHERFRIQPLCEIAGLGRI